MTLPAFILGCVIAGIFGAGFHLVTGGRLGRLISFLLVAEFSFWFGHVAGSILGWEFLSLGPICFGMAGLFSLIGLGLTAFLSSAQS
jgi:hypothetical protein